MVLYDGQWRAWRSYFLNIVCCCNFKEAKSREVCTVYQTTSYFSKTERPRPELYPVTLINPHDQVSVGIVLALINDDWLPSTVCWALSRHLQILGLIFTCMQNDGGGWTSWKSHSHQIHPQIKLTHDWNSNRSHWVTTTISIDRYTMPHPYLHPCISKQQLSVSQVGRIKCRWRARHLIQSI